MDDKDRKTNELIISASSQTYNSELGVTPEYSGNRNKWDSSKSKKEFKEKQFGDKQTIIDPKSGQILHKSHTAAKNKYHQKDKNGNKKSKKWAKRAAEVDHKISLNSLHENVKNNAFLSDNDLKEIANQECNYKLISKSENASKGAQNAKEPSTTLKLELDIASKTVKNAKSEFAKGAIDTVKSSAIIIVIDSVEQIIIEKKTVIETAKDAGKALGAAAVVGGTEKLIIDQTMHLLNNCSNEILKNIVDQNAVGQMLVMSAMIGQSLMRYINEEIDEKELAEEILINGATIALSTIITAAIPIPLIGSFVSLIAVRMVQGIYSTIKETRKHMDDYKKKEGRINALVAEATTVMDKKRTEFIELYSAEKEKWNNTITEGLFELLNSSLEDNYSLEGMVSGLDKILSVCDSQSKFHTVEEYESQLDMPLTLSF